jgi:hypothetical protein
MIDKQKKLINYLRNLNFRFCSKFFESNKVKSNFRTKYIISMKTRILKAEK